jgi:hypothetical protein
VHIAILPASVLPAVDCPFLINGYKFQQIQINVTEYKKTVINCRIVIGIPENAGF